MQSRQVLGLVVVIVTIALVASAMIGYSISSGRSGSSSLGSQTSFNVTFTACCDTSITSQFIYPISLNYSGSWNLVYWVINGTQNDVLGNLNGSGNYETAVSFYVVGYAQDTLCANATKLSNSQDYLTLSVLPTGLTGVNTNTTSASDSTVKVCATMAV